MPLLAQSELLSLDIRNALNALSNILVAIHVAMNKLILDVLEDLSRELCAGTER